MWLRLKATAHSSAPHDRSVYLSECPDPGIGLNYCLIQLKSEGTTAKTTNNINWWSKKSKTSSTASQVKHGGGVESGFPEISDARGAADEHFQQKDKNGQILSLASFILSTGTALE